MIPSNPFLFYLLDTPTGKAYYRDNNGNILENIVTANSDISLPNAPGNWLDTSLSFIRNSTYHGINRSFSTPQDFVLDAATMIKELFLLGVGTEVPLTLAVFKYNAKPAAGEPQYELYFKGNLDLSKISNTVLETLSVPVMEGGVSQLLKSYENTVLQIPCDGSIVENQKILMDGLLVPDVFYYQVTALNDIYEIDYNSSVSTPLSATFINDEGDNYGIIHADPSLDFRPSSLFDNTVIPNYCQTSVDYVFLSTADIEVILTGSVVIQFNKKGVEFQLFACTNAGQYFPISSKVFGYAAKQVVVNFNNTISLKANEGLFIMLQINYQPYGGETGHNVLNINSGSFSLSFVSKAADTRVWAITAYDLWRLIVKQICLLASTTAQTFNYEAVSNLLQQHLNFFITSGDALRASGDPTYQRYYSISQTNQILQTTFGPVIKITLKDFFQSMETILCASLGNSSNSNGETLFIETLRTVYDSSSVTFDIGEVASLKWSYDEEDGLSDFEIGYTPQTYDQKAGKYEYNTTLAMKAPVKSFQKKISKISKIRTDPYGIERVRSNIGATTSTTRNDSDSDVFLINADTTNFINDYFRAYFTSLISNPDDSNNTNQILIQNAQHQPLLLPLSDGEYFQYNNDQAIILFNDPAKGSPESITFAYDLTLNSNNKPPLAPTDSFTISLLRNGTVIFTQTYLITAINQHQVNSVVITANVNFQDVFYVAMSTSDTATANVNTSSINFGTYLVVNAANVPIDTGTPQKLLSWASFAPTSTPFTPGTSVAEYGYQYFVYNSIVPNSAFEVLLEVNGLTQGQVSTVEINVFVNGVLTVLQTVNTTVARQYFGLTTIPFTRTFQLNDVVFATIMPIGNTLQVEVQSAYLTFLSNYIKVYSLKRVQYDSLSGIPNLAKDSSGVIRTDIAGAPYNIEDLTPKTLYNNWKDYIMSGFLDSVTGDMIFQTLSKNQSLSRSYNGQIITENSNETILNSNRLFYPLPAEIKTNVPIPFAKLMSSVVNAHIHGTFMGNDFYFFPESLTQKPGLNESQTWKIIFSPKTSLKVLANISSFKIPDMQPNSIACAFSSSVKFVPDNQPLDPKYHTRNRDQFLFKEQTQNWLNKDDFGQLRQIGDPLNIQIYAYDLDPVYYIVYNLEDDSIFISNTNLTVNPSAAVQSPIVLWQTSIDTTTWPRNNYYIKIFGGVGDIAAVLRSEPQLLRNADECEDTFLAEASHSSNTQGCVFDGVLPYQLSMRIRGGFDNKFKQKYIGKTYIDQPQNITILNGIPYEITSLMIVGVSGVPDYIPKILLRFMLMDGCMFDGEGYTMNEGAEFEEVFTKGAPMKIQKIDIRPTKNPTGINVLANGIDTDSSIIVSVNPQSFGPNVSNSSGTTETDLVDIIVGP